MIAPDVACVLSACAMAITATVPDEGGCGGAVYGMGRPSGQAEAVVAVTAGTGGTYGVVAVAGIAGMAGLTVKKPQPLAQTCQSIPARVTSLATAAARFTVALGCICEGREGIKLTESVVDGLMATGLELMLAFGLATEVAAIVTEVPEEVTGGAV